VCVPSALYQDVEHVAILIHNPPEIMCFPVDLQVDARPVCHLSPQRGRRRRNSLA
jgi:hypothetical protein